MILILINPFTASIVGRTLGQKKRSSFSRIIYWHWLRLPSIVMSIHSLMSNQLLTCCLRLCPPLTVPCMVVWQSLLRRATCPHYDFFFPSFWLWFVHSHELCAPKRRCGRAFSRFVLESLDTFSCLKQECPSLTHVEADGYDQWFVDLELGLNADVALPYPF